MSNTGVEYSLSLKDLFTSKIKSATSATEKLNSSVGKIQSSFSGLGSALGIGFGIAGVVSFGKSVVDSLVNYEYFSASLRTLMNGDGKAAKALSDQLVSLAAKTPFSLTEVQDASKQLLAYGFSAGTVTKNISMLGDVASALKIPFSDIAYLYGTLKTQGRAYTRDIMQFTSRGIPIIHELAKQFKVADSDMMKLVTDGKVGFAEVEKAFKSMTSEGGQFFGMMDEQSKTVGGQLSNMGDQWEQLKVNIGKSQTGIIASTTKFFSTLIGEINQYFAITNDMDIAMSQKGGVGFGFFDTATKDKAYQELGAYNTFAERSQQSLKEALDAEKRLLYAQSSIRQRFLSGKLTESEMRNEFAISEVVMDKVRGNIALFNKKPEDTKAASLSGERGVGKAGTSTDAVETRRHQNFNISIDKLIEKLEFQTTNLKDSANTIKEEVTKALIGAVNDFQLMATK